MFAKEEEERLLAQEQATVAKRPRHDVLNFKTLVETNKPEDVSNLSTTMSSIVQFSDSCSLSPEAFTFDNDEEHQSALKILREQVQGLKVISRAKVVMHRICSVAYHPEVSKDLIFFGGSVSSKTVCPQLAQPFLPDKHGQLGIWDARAPLDDGDEDCAVAPENREGGKYWRLQLHWPASSKSSISNIKLDPIDAHKVRNLTFMRL